MEIQIQILEKTDIYTRILANYEGREYIFDISSLVPEEEVYNMTERYITLTEKLNF